MITVKEATEKAKKKDKGVYTYGETKDAYLFFLKDIPFDDEPHGVAVYKESGRVVKMATYDKNGGANNKVKMHGVIGKPTPKKKA